MSEQIIQSHLDLPRPGEKIYDAAIFISGWIHAPHRDSSAWRVRAYLDGALVGECSVLSVRADVCDKLQLAPGTPTAFRILGRAPSSISETRDAMLRITASGADHPETEIAQQPVRLVPAALSLRPYGEVVYPTNTTLLHRENIYGSGPPLEEPGAEVLNLLLGYLPAGSSVVDVGCGAGAYGPPLIGAGHDWLGLESNSYCGEILERRQLPFRRVDPESGRLPCADREWESAICIEVLEHVKEADVFLSEIARIVRGRALFSVPNLEVLPYFHGWGVVPWHLLEGDHKNFFTRGSLHALLARFFGQVEVFSYGDHPLRSREDIALHVHLFAIADK